MPRNTIPGFRIEAEIFSTGTWNNETFTEEDLHEIARNFIKLKPHIKPPLKFGHDEHQTLLGQSDGDPTLGWVEQLKVQGEKLLATFVGVPLVVYDAIKSQRYRRVSAEIYFNLRQNGEELGKALKAVALLGADLPAVTNLEDLTAFLTDRPHYGLQVGESRVYTSLLSGAGIIPISEEQTEMSEISQVEELQAELRELRTYKSDQEAHLEAGMVREREQAFREAKLQAMEFCAEQRKAGRLPPALAQSLIKQVEDQAAAFSQGEGLKVPFAWLRRFIVDTPPALPQGEVGHSIVEPYAEQTEPDNPSNMLASLASAKMVEMNLGYGQAAEYVLKTNPALAQAYREYTLNPNQGE